jgi:phosphoadenosine phosphosulfate reductase
MNIEKINIELATKTPIEIVQWAITNAQSPIVTTNFRPYESAILHLVTSVDSKIKVIWCDTGYNTSSTYKHAEELIESLALNIQLYIPKQTAAHRDMVLGIPQVDDPKHQLFTEQVKLEPFKRAMTTHKPDVWFTNLRKGQTRVAK